MDLALKRVAQHKGIGEFFASGAKNACSMWFGVLPTVMAVGTVALILANHTPIFAWLGLPFQWKDTAFSLFGWVCPSSPCWSCSVCPRPVRLPPR